MKKALRKNFYMEIRHSLGRFLSIFFIVAIGCAFFSGIRASEPDMRYSGDAYFDEKNLMDIQVMSTMGLTEDDLDAIRAVDGVLDAEGSYATDVLCTIRGNQIAVHVMALQNKMNQVQLEDGRLPEKENECVIDADYLDGKNLKIGDKITLSSGTSDSLEDTLKTDTFTIVGTVSSPEYIAFHRGSTTIGNGSVSAFLCVPEKAFSLDVYTEITVQIEGAKEATAFTKEYEEHVDPVLKKVQAIKAEREQARYDEITSTAQEKVDEAQEELAQAEQDLADGKKEAEEELASAREKLDAAQKELERGRNQLAASKLELEQSRNLLISKQKELDQSKAQVEQGAQELSEKQIALTTLRNQLAQLKEQEESLEDQRQELLAQQTQMQQKKDELLKAKEELQQQAEDYQSAYQQIYQPLKQSYEELNTQYELLLQNYEALKEEYDRKQEAGEEDPELKAQLEQLEAEKTAMEEKLTELKANLDKMELEAKAAEAEIQKNQTKIEAGLTQINEGIPAVEAGIAQIEEGIPILQDNIQKLTDVLTQGDAAILTASRQIDQAKAQITSGQQQIDSGWQQISEGQKKIEEAQQQLSSGTKELEDGWAEYEEGRIEAQKKIEDGERQITEAREELAKAQQKIDDLEKPKWYVYDRNNLTEYSGYGDNADRMRAIGKVFPLIFFLVAALISLTTMTRMVEEERTQIGTLKALGYGNTSIVGKYLWYAILATLTGGVFGILIGEKIIPYIIITAYKIMYRHMHDVVIPYNLYYAVTACAAALACTVIATLFSCMKELREQAAELMRPPTPKQGKRVFLERVPFIWKNLNFTWKSTVRNLVRYKKRFFMTVFGIGGCMGMMLFGFGLKDSISAIVPLQYEQIQLYDGDVILKEDVTEEERNEVQKELDTDKKVSVTAENLLKNIEISSGESSQEVYLDVPKDVEAFKKFVVIRDRKTKEIYSLDDKGAILTEKAAKLLEVDVGDKLTIDTDDGEKTVLISAICENYMGHYLYMTSEVYEKTFGEAPAYNSIYYRTQDRTTEEAKDVGENVMKCDGTLSISYTTSLKKQVDHMLESLDIVIIVLIISAGMLAFVVLYNLNNINITERKRELATLKVLGFYDKEVSSYVYRENILLTLIGALAGLLIGKILHRFIVETVEIDSVMFGRNIDPPSFLYAFLLTVAFSLFVNGVMYFKLKKINMVESLKSVE